MVCLDVEVYGLDINLVVFDLVWVNVVLVGVGNLILVCSDLLSQVFGCFDLIVVNLFYFLDVLECVYWYGGGMFGVGFLLVIVDVVFECLEVGGSLLLYIGVVMVEGGDLFFVCICECLVFWEWDWDYQELDLDVFVEELDSFVYCEVEWIVVVGLWVICFV